MQACAFNCNKSSLVSGIRIAKQLSTEVLLVGSGAAPTILLSHGSGGKWEHQTRWAKTLKNSGFNVVILDHFTERGVRPHVARTNYDTLPVQRVQDIVAVAKWVSLQNWNSGKIGVIGFSQGGSGVNLLANTLEVVGIDGIDADDLQVFGALVSYYPGCGLPGGTPPDQPYVPIMIHIGMADSLAEPFWCTSGFRENENLTIFKYDGAPHSFDVEIPGWRKTGVIPGVNRRWLAERHEPSNALSRQRTLDFFDAYLK